MRILEEVAEQDLRACASSLPSNDGIEGGDNRLLHRCRSPEDAQR
jgi:hypothetical protein